MNVSKPTSKKIQKRVISILFDDPKISCRRLSKLLGCGKERANNILTGKARLDADDIRTICIHYKVNPVWLLGLEAYNYDDV